MTEVRVPDGGGSSLHLVEVDGFRYPPFPEDCIRAVRGLDIRPDDVLVCAYPKSGTHWAWELVRQLLANDESAGAKHGQKELDVKEKDDGMLEMTSEEQLQAMPSPRVLNTHVYFDQLPTQVVKTGCRVVTVVRDPRDVAVSYYHHHTKLADLYHYTGQWSHYLPLFLHGHLDYGSWFDYHVSWERGLLTHPELPVLPLCYESMKQDSLGATRQLAEFLGVQCSEDRLRAVNQACDFHTMKMTKGHMETDTEGRPIMYRKGEVGDWKNVFTVAQAEEFGKVYKAKVKELLVIRSAATVDGTPPHIPLAARYNTQL